MFTHVVFSAGAVVALLPSLPVDVRFLLAGASSVLVNFVIDAFGHSMHGDFVARSPLTHSVVTAPIWGGALGYVLWAAGANFGVVGVDLQVACVSAGVIVALVHLLLDSLTERGVYLLTDRMALAHFRSDNGILNTLFLLGGFVLFLA